MVLAQIQKKGFFDVLRSAGVRGLYHGAEATLYRDITFNQALFVLRAIIMEWYENSTGEEPSPLRKVWYGLPASITAGIIACPFDVVKTRVQGRELHELGMSLYQHGDNSYYSRVFIIILAATVYIPTNQTPT